MFLLAAPMAKALDLDADGLSDVWQRQHGISGAQKPLDPDADGMSNEQEALAFTNPHEAGSRLEIRSMRVDANRAVRLTVPARAGVVYHIQGSRDLASWEEVAVRSYTTTQDQEVALDPPVEPDEGFRYFRIEISSTDQTDEDSDGLSKAEEGFLGSNPGKADSDDDLMSDAFEAIHSLDPTDPSDGHGDPDNDGSLNFEESERNSNPSVADTDGDLVPDDLDADPSHAIVDWERSPAPGYAWVEIVEAPKDPNSVNNAQLTDDPMVLFGPDGNMTRIMKVWEKGTWRDLPTSGPGFTSFYPVDAGNGGIVVGTAAGHGVVWCDSSVASVLTLEGGRPRETYEFDLTPFTGGYGPARTILNRSAHLILPIETPWPIPPGEQSQLAPAVWNLRESTYSSSGWPDSTDQVGMSDFHLFAPDGTLFTTLATPEGTRYIRSDGEEGVVAANGLLWVLPNNRFASFGAAPAYPCLLQSASGAMERFPDLDGAVQINMRGEAIDTHGRVWRNGKWTNLNSFLPATMGVFTRLDAIDLNQKGVILCGLRDAGGTGFGDYEHVGLLVPAALVPDVNRDGVINYKDHGRISSTRPWRWWINDDNDTDDVDTSWINENNTPGNDLIADSNNFSASYVDGLEDFEDFYPLFLDVRQLLDCLPANATLYLDHASGSSQFLLSPFPTTFANAHVIEPLTAKNIVGRTVVSMANAPIDPAYVASIRDGSVGGIILVEGSKVAASTINLRAVVDGMEVGRYELPVRYTGVEDMFRWINVRHADGVSEDRPTNVVEPVNFPDRESNGKMFVFVHGYNVDERQGRGWCSEVFKRMYQCGSHAMFTAVAWRGDFTQLQIFDWGKVCPDYWRNVTTAFQSAETAKNSIGLLPRVPTTLAAHSLGNMLASSMIADYSLQVRQYFMLDAAVASEAYDPSTLEAIHMTDSDWTNVPARYFASQWHKLFLNRMVVGEVDARSKLTWQNRFGAFPHAWNFYSSGEEVLDKTTFGNHPLLVEMLEEHHGSQSWITQELTKGEYPQSLLLHVDQGGWQFNPAYFAYPFPPLQGSYSDDQLIEQPFFFPFFDQDLMSGDPLTGHTAAKDRLTRAEVLAAAIPALSFAAGRQPIPAFYENEDRRNCDLMNLKNQQNYWPIQRTSDDFAKDRWLHGDAVDVALCYNNLLFKKWIDIAALR